VVIQVSEKAKNAILYCILTISVRGLSAYPDSRSVNRMNRPIHACFTLRRTPCQLREITLFRQQCYVAGDWIDADSGAVSTITNPATGEILGHVPELGAAETRRAIEAAHAALAGLASADRAGAGGDFATLVRRCCWNIRRIWRR
jgi:hypothetical protein